MLSITVIIIISSIALIAAGGYVETSWPPHGAQNTPSGSRSSVPTIAYHYQPRQRHNTWRGSYYASQPKIQIPGPETKLSPVDAIASNERRNRIQSSGVYRTYGKGRAIIPYRGAVVHIPRTTGANKAYKVMVSGRVFDPPKIPSWETNDVISRSRRDCAGCPLDEMVVAAKGNAYVLLPEPCSYKWETVSGPKPGSKLTEGVHFITGTIGNRKKVCNYKYQVKVRHCPPLQGQNADIFCSADNAWGSKCNFTCPRNLRIEGSSTNECNDDLKWSTPEPLCKDTRDCLIPNLENTTKFNCETNDISNAGSDYLPEHTHCKIKTNGIESAMKCRKGEWRKVSPKGKHRRNKLVKKEDLNPCNPNPCLHGGSCMVSSNEFHSTFICVCSPNHEGPRCEFTECTKNPCKNDARCFNVNGELNCFCSSNFTGTYCETTL